MAEAARADSALDAVHCGWVLVAWGPAGWVNRSTEIAPATMEIVGVNFAYYTKLIGGDLPEGLWICPQAI
jgi:hypothetical protein